MRSAASSRPTPSRAVVRAGTTTCSSCSTRRCASASSASSSIPSGEHCAGGDGVVYWTVPKGDTLDSHLGATIGKAAYASALTSRNVNTLDKLLA